MKNVSLKKNKLTSKRSVKVSLLCYFETICPECNAKHGPFGFNDIKNVVAIKCDSCGLILEFETSLLK